MVDNRTPALPEHGSPSRAPEPLRPNPGGRLDPHDVVGREDEIARLHEAITHGGAYVRGERRVGKTSILNRLADDLDQSACVVFVSAQTSSLETFEQRFLHALRFHHIAGPRIMRWQTEVTGEIRLSVGPAGFKLGGTSRRDPAGVRQVDAIDLLLEAAGQRSVVLIVDEIADLCWALGEDDATELLRGLRVARQTNDRVAVVLSGSIGLHHALSDLSMVNDLLRLDVGPLSPQHAQDLAARLMAGIGMPPDPGFAALAAAEVDGHPFFLQALFEALVREPTIADDPGGFVDQTIAEGGWDTAHLVTRIEKYYGDEAPLAYEVLDLVAVATAPQVVEDLSLALLAQGLDPAPTRDRLLSLLDRLEADHYLERVGVASTMPPFMSRIWRIRRRLR